MNEKLIQIIEKYEPTGGDELAFMQKHTDNISVFDGPGVEEIRAAINSVGTFDRSENNYGNDAGDDEEVYESIANAIQGYLDESSEEEARELQSIIEDEESFLELISVIMEKEEEDDDDEDEDEDDEDEDEDEDEDDEKVDVKPTVKEKKDKMYEKKCMDK